MNFCKLLKHRCPNKLKNGNNAELIREQCPNTLESFAFNGLSAFQSSFFFLLFLLITSHYRCRDWEGVAEIWSCCFEALMEVQNNLLAKKLNKVSFQLHRVISFSVSLWGLSSYSKSCKPLSSPHFQCQISNYAFPIVIDRWLHWNASTAETPNSSWKVQKMSKRRTTCYLETWFLFLLSRSH